MTFLGADSASGGLSSVRESHLDQAIRTSVIITVVVNVVHLAVLLLPGDPASRLVVGLSLTAQWLPVSVFWLVAVRVSFGRGEVILAGVGLACNAAGRTFHALATDTLRSVPLQSLADLGQLLCYPLVMAGVIALVIRQSRTSANTVAFDGTLASLGAASVLTVILGPIFEDATHDATSRSGFVAPLYPFFDLIVLTVIVGISASPVLRIGPRWQFLVLGLLVFVGADIVYAFLERDAAYVRGTPLDAAWPIGVAFGALWVAGVGRVRLEPPSGISSTRMLPVPAVAVLAGLGVLLAATRMTVPGVALVLAAATVALSAVPVMFRHAALIRMLASQEQVVERLIALDKSKSDMIGTVSHEMRTPLASVLGYLELVLDDEDASIPEATKSLLRVADRNAHRLDILVGNMLLITQLESGAATPKAAPVDLALLLRRTMDSLRLLAEAKEVELALISADSVVVEGDESQLERAFTNLIENAVKFTPASGSIRIEVAPATGPTGRPAVMVDVIDTGMGIPADEIPHLFDRFYRATNAQTGVVPGTGLGLAIVREIVHAHQGDVTVSSVLGTGTTFCIALPKRRSDGVGSLHPKPLNPGTGAEKRSDRSRHY